MVLARPHLSVISKNITNKLNGRSLDKYLEDVLLKDKSPENVRLIDSTLKAFQALDSIIDMSPQ